MQMQFGFPNPIGMLLINQWYNVSIEEINEGSIGGQ